MLEILRFIFIIAWWFIFSILIKIIANKIVYKKDSDEEDICVVLFYYIFSYFICNYFITTIIYNSNFSIDNYSSEYYLPSAIGLLLALFLKIGFVVKKNKQTKMQNKIDSANSDQKRSNAERLKSEVQNLMDEKKYREAWNKVKYSDHWVINDLKSIVKNIAKIEDLYEISDSLSLNDVSTSLNLTNRNDLIEFIKNNHKYLQNYRIRGEYLYKDKK